MNTGEHLWKIPHGDMAQARQEAFRANALLKDVANLDTNWGRRGHPGPWPRLRRCCWPPGKTADNKPHLFGIDKKTGKRVGSVEMARLGGYGLMTYLHQGKQYIVVPINGGYTAMALP